MKLLLASLLFIAAVLPAYSQAPATPAPAAAAPAKPVGPADKKFIKDLSEGILIEQKYLSLITPKAATLSEATKRTVTTMDGELKRIWTGLTALAQTKGAEVAKEANKNDVAKADRLAKEKPDKFEKEFFKELSKETAKTSKVIEASKTLQDAEIKRFAEDWTPAVKTHEKGVEAAEKAAGGKK